MMKLILTWIVLVCLGGFALSASPDCSQAKVESELGTGWTAPSLNGYQYIYAKPALGGDISPTYQWMNNGGYSGETFMRQAASSVSGTWLSQWNMREMCGSGLSQSGGAGYCASHHGYPAFNARAAAVSSDCNCTGTNPYASMSTCLSNIFLNSTAFNSANQFGGLQGYQQFMSWVKSQVIQGFPTVIGVIARTKSDRNAIFHQRRDDQFDLWVTVIAIATKHAVSSTYYDDDVIIFDDHGAYQFLPATASGGGGKLRHWGGGSAVPPGADPSDTKGCTPYLYTYTFSSLAHSRSSAKNAFAYSIVLPSNTTTIKTRLGGNDGGYYCSSVSGPNNFGLSVLGPVSGMGSSDGSMPTSVQVLSASSDGSTVNIKDPVAGFNYESPFIGSTEYGGSCTQAPPSNFMSVTLRVTAWGLTSGSSYALFWYRLPMVTDGDVGTDLKYTVDNLTPTQDDMLLLSSQGTSAISNELIPFVASGTSYDMDLQTTSDLVHFFRVIPISAFPTLNPTPSPTNAPVYTKQTTILLACLAGFWILGTAMMYYVSNSSKKDAV